jgi:signal transduction histidine kinase
LDRLFWNIISNSIFYNEWNNEIKIIIDKNNIIIEDKWIWINKEEIGKIFTRFYRNKNSWLYYKNWNWLWLVIVKKICDMFWWKIDIDSELKKWTKISIFL